MYQFPIGVMLESFRLPTPEAVKKAAEVGAKGIQMYSTNGEHAPENMTPAKCAELLDMLTILADHYEAAEDPAKAAIKRRQIRDIRRAFSDDFPTPYTKAALEAYPENV